MVPNHQPVVYGHYPSMVFPMLVPWPFSLPVFLHYSIIYYILYIIYIIYYILYILYIIYIIFPSVPPTRHPPGIAHDELFNPRQGPSQQRHARQRLGCLVRRRCVTDLGKIHGKI